MSRALRRSRLTPAPATKRPLRFAEETAQARRSPARELQSRLADELAMDQTARRWSARRSLAFIGASSALLWSGLIGLGWLALR